MAGRNRKKPSGGDGPWYRAPWLAGLLLVAGGAYGALSLTGDAGPWTGIIQGRTLDRLFPDGNPGGPVGSLLNVTLRLGFGSLWCWAVPALMLAFGVGALGGNVARPRGWALRALPLWLASTAWLGQADWPLGASGAATWGGAAGFHLARLFHRFFGTAGGHIFLTVALLVAIGAVAGRRLAWLGVLARAVGRGLAALCGWIGRGLGGFPAWAGATAARLWAARPRRTAAAPAPVSDGEAQTAPAAKAAAAAARERVVHQVSVPLKGRGAVGDDEDEDEDEEEDGEYGDEEDDDSEEDDDFDEADDIDDPETLALPGADGEELADDATCREPPAGAAAGPQAGTWPHEDAGARTAHAGGSGRAGRGRHRAGRGGRSPRGDPALVRCRGRSQGRATGSRSHHLRIPAGARHPRQPDRPAHRRPGAGDARPLHPHGSADTGQGGRRHRDPEPDRAHGAVARSPGTDGRATAGAALGHAGEGCGGPAGGDRHRLAAAPAGGRLDRQREIGLPQCPAVQFAVAQRSVPPAPGAGRSRRCWK